MEIDFEADAFDEGRHLRDVIRGHKGFSSALWKRIKWNGEVWLNGTRIHNAKTVLHEGDRVRLVWDESSDIVPADIPLDILYEDDTLLVVNKGTGMIIHPTNAGIHDTLVNAVAGYFQKKGEESGIHPVYRLDRNTTGVVVVAKSAKAQYALTRSHDRMHRGVHRRGRRLYSRRIRYCRRAYRAERREHYRVDGAERRQTRADGVYRSPPWGQLYRFEAPSPHRTDTSDPRPCTIYGNAAFR